MKTLFIWLAIMAQACNCMAWGVLGLGGRVFAGASHTLSEDFESVADWTNITGTIAATGGVGYGSAVWSTTTAYHSTSLGSANQEVQAGCQVNSSMNDRSSVIARSNGTNFYEAYITYGVLRIRSSLANREIATYDGSYSAGRHTIKLYVSGTGATVTIRGSVDGTQVIDTTDTHADRLVSGNYAGVLIWRDQNNTNSTIDDWWADAL